MAANRAPLRPGKPTPIREVPASIPRPEYVWKPTVKENQGEPFVQTPEVIEAMREASAIAANALRVAGAAVAPGVSTDEIDRIAHEYMCDHGAYPSTLGYLDFPKSCCVSLNEIICHGIPDTTVLRTAISSISMSPPSRTACMAILTQPSWLVMSPRNTACWSSAPRKP